MAKRSEMRVSKSLPQWVISEIFTEAGNLGTRIRRGLQTDHLHVNVSLMPHTLALYANALYPGSYGLGDNRAHALVVCFHIVELSSIG